MKHPATVLAGLLAIASLAFVCGASAADIGSTQTNPESVTVTADTIASGDALFIYNTVGTEFTFKTDSKIKAWVLAVGGGGAGGGSTTTSNLKSSMGAGGGGGGGGFVESNAVVFAKGTYKISIGAGGTKGGSYGNGGNGGESSISYGGAKLFAALGGGGGAKSGAVGVEGASGGGGSYGSSESQAGGASDALQGSAGGSGNYIGAGAGGGGAGGVGGSVLSAKHAGTGGLGKASSITGSAVLYAPGGGGGSNDYPANGGNNDGTGNGAGTSAATAGANGLGGGGGGGDGKSRNGAIGGSGVVIIRVTKVFGEVQIPADNQEKDYTGSPITIWEGDEDIEITGGDSLTQTEVGSYTFSAKPKDDVLWSDNTSEEKTFHWKIVKASNSLSLSLDGWVEGSPNEPVCEADIGLETVKIEYSPSAARNWSTEKPTTPGNYLVQATIAETANYAGASAGPVAFRIIGATTVPNENLGFYAPVTFPDCGGATFVRFTVNSGFGFVTKDNPTSGLCLCSIDGTPYPQSVTWANGSATIEAEIADLTATKTVYLCWGVAVGKSAPALTASTLTSPTTLVATFGSVVRDTSRTLQNYVEDLSIGNWRQGEAASTPSFRYKIGTPVVRYATAEEGPFDLTDVPSVAGSYWVSVSIPEESGTDNGGPYVGVAEQKLAFKVLAAAESPIKSLKYFAEITNQTALSAGRVTVSVPTGFNWKAAYNDGTDVRFCDLDGTIYKSRLVTWGGDGSATYSVEIPELAAKSLTCMCWGEAVGSTVPAVSEPTATTDCGTLAPGTVIFSDAALTLKNWVKDLTIKSFRLNSDDAVSIPTCTYKIGTVTYKYSKFKATSYVEYDAGNPPEAGTYYMKAFIAADTGYEAAESDAVLFRILSKDESPLASLAWWSRVTLTGSSVTAGRVTLTLPKTLDYKTINNDGSDIRFCDAAGTVYPASLSTAWATNGTAKFSVEVPAFTTKCAFYMCWGPVVGQTIPSAPAYSTTTTISPSATFATAVRDTTKWPLVNHWVSDPAYPSAWAKGDTVTYTPGVPAYGTFKILCRDIATDETTVITTLPDKAGDYSLYSVVDAGEYWAGMTNEAFDVSVTEHNPTISLKGDAVDAGAAGRVLLMNDDTTPGAEVSNQDYGALDPTLSTFWEHSKVASMPYATKQTCLSNETYSILWTTNHESRLWTLVDCRQGNPYPKNDSSSINLTRNGLPWKSPMTRAQARQIVMRNMTTACVYSPCYSNGVGTIYFDAVNSGTTHLISGAEAFQLRVSIATNCVTSLDEEIDIAPTDEYVHAFDEEEPDADAILTNANWQVVEAIPVKVLANAIDQTQAKTDTITLDIENGGSSENFYRLIVPVDVQGPVRFKIERVARDTSKDVDVLAGYLILDNIVVSYPAMRATIATMGEYDSTRKGLDVLGQQLALSEAFPSVSSTDLRGRGQVSTYTNAGVKDPDTSSFVVSARFNYRWRYLNQSYYHDGNFYTADDGKFASVRLSPATGYVSNKALDLPGLPGDLEYYYELVLAAPYYEYVDYSGLNIGVGDYTEEISSYIGAADSSFRDLPSGGTNWFVRVREGASPYEKVELYVQDSSVEADTPTTEAITMQLVGDHQWRGFVTVTNKTARDITFWLRGVNKQTDGATEYDTSGDNDDEFRVSVPVVDITESPYSGSAPSTQEAAGHRAHLIYLKGVSSYVEFQFNDNTKALSISHADYQDFNVWASSRSVNGDKFYSSAHETNSTTIATTRYPSDRTTTAIEGFAETPITKTAWSEDFAVDKGQSTVGFPKNEPFVTQRTPHGWLADQGMWVAQKWGMTNSNDFALQLEGRGKGSTTFNLTPAPDGLDTISFTTRMAQFSDFDNISYCYTGFGKQNYTIAAQAAFDDDPGFKNFSGEASISLFTGYIPKKGCYEYRITIYNVDEYSDTINKTDYKYAKCRHAIYKWHVDGGALVATPLVDTFGDTSNNGKGFWWWDATNSKKADVVKELPLGPSGSLRSAMYMSFAYDSASGQVTITAGVNGGSANKSNAIESFVCTSKSFLQIGCVDKSPVTTAGTYGVLMKNCPGTVLFPRIYDETVALPSTTDGAVADGGGFRWKGNVPLLSTATGYTMEKENILTSGLWALEPGRVTVYNYRVSASLLYWGLAADTTVAQSVNVYTMPVDSTDNWSLLKSIPVTSFADTEQLVTLQSPKSCYVKFAAGGTTTDVRTDVVIDSIVMNQWCGQNGSATNALTSYGYSRDFYYTGAWISNRVDKIGGKSVTRKVALLAPRRAESATSSVGIRTPYLEGFGSLSFTYANAWDGARLVVQRWVGSANNLYGHLDDPEDEDSWETITNYTFHATDATKTRTVYLGERAPSNGVIRISVPQTVVAEALSHSEYDPNWMAIEIVDISCFDEPAFDSHSWWGWNFLTTGWSDGQPNSYAALSDHDEGAVGMLNNTVTEVKSLQTGDTSDYDKNNPFIQSPTFTGRTIGEVSFRARAYSSSTPSYVTVWGAKDGELQNTESWVAVTNVLVDARTYRQYSVKCSDEQAFAAIRLGVAEVSGILEEHAMEAAAAAELPSTPTRVVLDEIVIRERVKPEVGFRLNFARPFRLGLTETTAVEDIDSRDQQPLLGEQFGFQAEVEVTGLSEEVDLDGHPPVVYLSYYVGAEPWGYAKWKDEPGAVLDVELAAATGTNLVYRSTGAVAESLTGPHEATATESYRIVQYFFTVKYWDKGGDPHTSRITASQWSMPSWYYGFSDPNEGETSAFSPFTVLDTVSPGRAWFNEINFASETSQNENQLVEVCFPAGYDMTGWRIYRYDRWGFQELLAALGMTTDVPKTKSATGGDPNFAFLALTAQEKPIAGADANWSRDVSAGSASDTYGFQLVRPSGIIEQQIVVQGKLGTSPWAKNKLGTNVVAELSTLVGGTWQLVGCDTNAVTKSTGVFRNAGAEPSDWNDTMDLSPGRINGDETIPADWFLPPSGTNIWLSISTLGDHIWVVDAKNRRVTATTLVVPLGVETNLCFETSPWYQLGTLVRDSTDDVTADATSAPVGGGTNRWSYAFREESKNSVTLQATATPDAEVVRRGKLDPNDRYTPAVMEWLLGGQANGQPFEGDTISTNCFFQGLSVGSTREELPLRERYWLDIDPTSDAWDLRGSMGGLENLSASVPTVPVVHEVRRDRSDRWPVPVTNRVVTVAMMISNKVDHARSYAPYRLQGLGGEQSDVVGASNWTSVTFKVMMSLIKSKSASGIDVSDTYWPMSSFVFGPGSFCGRDADHPFSARIEILDPMSKGSPAYTYGWLNYPDSTFGYKWDLSHGAYMQSPSLLNATNTWDNTWEANDDY